MNVSRRRTGGDTLRPRTTRRGFLRDVTAAGIAVSSVGLLARRAGAQAMTPKRGGTLRILQTEPAVGFNPVLEGTNWPETNRMVYNGLTDSGPSGELIPGVAKSWEVSDAADVFTFHLSPGVLFSDGKELTSADVKFTYEMALDPKVGSAFLSYIPNLKTVETPDKYTVTLRFDGPNVLFLPAVSALGIVPQHLWAGSDPLKSPYLSKPVGTGPFILQEWKRGDSVTFTANPNYFRKGLPYLDGVVFKVIPDSSVGIESFKNGELDAVFSQGMAGGLPYLLVRRLIQSKPTNMVIQPFSQSFTQVFYMNCVQPPLNNVKVRQAVVHAIDTDFIIKTLLYGFGQQQTTIVGNLPGTAWAFDPTVKPLAHSVAMANSLLDEAGYRRAGNGTRFTLTVLATEGFRVQLSQALKSMLAPVGIETSIKAYTWPTYFARISQQRDTAGCIWTIFNSRESDPSLTVLGLDGNAIKPGGDNYVQWNNPQVTSLIASARTTANREKRKPMYDKIQQIVADQVPVLPLYSALGCNLWYQYVQGIHSLESLTGTMRFVEDAWLNK